MINLKDIKSGKVFAVNKIKYFRNTKAETPRCIMFQKAERSTFVNFDVCLWKDLTFLDEKCHISDVKRFKNLIKKTNLTLKGFYKYIKGVM